MMRKIKTNIKRWKLVAFAIMLPGMFMFIACQDQVADDMSQIAQNSSHALIVPAHIQKRYEQVKKENPDKQFALLELNETASAKLQELEAQYGLPNAVEVFKTVNGKPVDSPVRGESAAGVILENGNAQDKDALKADGEQTFAIIEFNDAASKISEASSQEQIFTVVEEQPQFPGGYDSLTSFIRRNLRYPTVARTMGVEGTVYVSFVVWADGSVSQAKVIRGIHESCDLEAKRVVEMFPKWKPGRQTGRDVSVRFVIPIKFAMG